MGENNDEKYNNQQQEPLFSSLFFFLLLFLGTMLFYRQRIKGGKNEGSKIKERKKHKNRREKVKQKI
jgi:hypothetical protein